MRTLTVVTPRTRTLPRDMSPLIAPVRIASGDEAGRAVGVVLEEDAGILAFVIELANTLERGAPWALVTASAVTVTDDAGLLLSLDREALLSQPRIRRAAPAALAGVERSSVQVATPGSGAGGSANPVETIAEGIEGGAVGAAAGAVAGMAAGGPLALALAAFFGAGGALLGLVSGASKRLADDREDVKRAATSTSDASRAAMGRLAALLHDPTLSASGLVDVERFTVDGGTADRPGSIVSERHANA